MEVSFHLNSIILPSFLEKNPAKMSLVLLRIQTKKMSNFWCCGRQVCPSINIWTVSSLANALFNIGTLDSFLAGSESNWVFGVCCSVQMVFQQVQTSSTKHTTGIKNPSIYNIIRWFPGLLEQMTKCLMFQVLFFFH